MDVSITIVNYNTKDLLKQCIESVFEKTQDVEFEIIVVDNASSDGSQQMVKELFPKVTLIESPENLGFGRANNLGNKVAKGKYLFILNSDTILIENSIYNKYINMQFFTHHFPHNKRNKKTIPIITDKRNI
jgi:GT2 family glycosyltransferase